MHDRFEKIVKAKAGSGARIGAGSQRLEQPISLQQELRAGDTCPKCKCYLLDYDGLLNLACPECGIAGSGCFT